MINFIILYEILMFCIQWLRLRLVKLLLKSVYNFKPVSIKTFKRLYKRVTEIISGTGMEGNRTGDPE